MRGRLAVECHYRMSEIDAMRFSDVIRMADFWAMEPPIAWTYSRVHGYGKKEDSGNSIPGVHRAATYEKLPRKLQEAFRQAWLLRNPGKTEKDFFAERRQMALEKYKHKLETARAAKQNG